MIIRVFKSPNVKEVKVIYPDHIQAEDIQNFKTAEVMEKDVKKKNWKTLGRLFMGRETVLDNFESIFFLKKQRTKDQQQQKLKHFEKFKHQKQ